MVPMLDDEAVWWFSAALVQVAALAWLVIHSGQVLAGIRATCDVLCQRVVARQMRIDLRDPDWSLRDAWICAFRSGTWSDIRIQPRHRWKGASRGSWQGVNRSFGMLGAIVCSRIAGRPVTRDRG